MGLAAAATALLGLNAGQFVMQKQALDAQKDATNKATENAKATATAAEQASNKANQKKPDTGALLSANIAGGKTGQGSTMLTGPAGVDPTLLQLGKTTLLGGGG